MWTVNRTGTYDLWLDENKNGIFDGNDIINDGHTETYPMIAVSEFSVVSGMLLIVLSLGVNSQFCRRTSNASSKANKKFSPESA